MSNHDLMKYESSIVREALKHASQDIKQLGLLHGDELHNETLQGTLDNLMDDDPNFTDDLPGHIWETYQTMSAWMMYASINVSDEDLENGTYIRKFRLIRSILYWLSLAHNHSINVHIRT